MSYTLTESQIEKDFYLIIKSSAINSLINGTLYRKGMRPANAKTEDAVVAFLTGLEGQFQTGVVLLNIYVPKIDNKTSGKVKDTHRVDTLQAAVKDFFEAFSDPYYELELRETPYSEDLEEIQQTRINTRIYYRRTTF